MPLKLLLLGDRTTPALWHGGEFYLSGVGAVHPFEDWHGTLNVLAAGEQVYVGAGVGGGPRVAELSAVTGLRTRPDYWAGDPGDRSGVVFVPAPAGRPDPPEELVPVGPVTLGPPDAFTVFVDFEAPADVPAVMAGLHALLPDLRITSKRPDLRPDLYGTAVLDGSLEHDPRHPAGIAYADWTDGQPFGVSEMVFVDAKYHPTARDQAGGLDHEIRHGLKLIPDEA